MIPIFRQSAPVTAARHTSSHHRTPADLVATDGSSYTALLALLGGKATGNQTSTVTDQRRSMAPAETAPKTPADAFLVRYLYLLLSLNNLLSISCISISPSSQGGMRVPPARCCCWPARHILPQAVALSSGNVEPNHEAARTPLRAAVVHRCSSA